MIALEGDLDLTSAPRLRWALFDLAESGRRRIVVDLSPATFMDSTTFNVMLGVEILMFVVVGGGSTFLGPLVGAAVLNAIPEILRALRDWLELIPVAWTNFFPVNRVYDFLHDFLDFENAKRLIAYGIILIIMMILRPDGLVTRDSLRRLVPARWKARHA